MKCLLVREARINRIHSFVLFLQIISFNKCTEHASIIRSLCEQGLTRRIYVY